MKKVLITLLLSLLVSGVFSADGTDYYLRNPIGLDYHDQDLNEEELEYSLVDGKVYIGDMQIPVKAGINEENKGEYTFYAQNSPSNKYKLIYYSPPATIAPEFYLLKDQKIEKINIKELGKHWFVRWLGPDYFEIQWSGMGYSMSLVAHANKPNMQYLLNDLIAFLPKKNEYIALSLSDDNKNLGCYIEFSRLSDSKLISRFRTGHDVEYLTECFFDFKKLTLFPDHFVVTYKNAHDKVYKYNISFK